MVDMGYPFSGTLSEGLAYEVCRRLGQRKYHSVFIRYPRISHMVNNMVVKDIDPRPQFIGSKEWTKITNMGRFMEANSPSRS